MALKYALKFRFESHFGPQIYVTFSFWYFQLHKYLNICNLVSISTVGVGKIDKMLIVDVTLVVLAPRRYLEDLLIALQ